MVSESLLWHFLSSLVFISVTPFFFNIASAITTTAVAFRRSTSNFIQPSSLGSGPAAAVVKEFHTAQTTAARITATNIAQIAVLKLPQRSSRANLQNRERFNIIGDCTRPHAPLKVSVRLITRSTRRHAPARACFLLLTSALVTSSATSSADVIVWPDCWLALTLTQGWLFQSRFFLPSFSRRFHFCSLFLHIVSLNG